MGALKDRLIEYILLRNSVDKKVVEKLNKESESFQDFKKKLIEENVIKEKDMLIVFSKEYKFPYLDLDRYNISDENKDYLPEELSRKYKVLPISKIGEVLTLATSNPLDIIALDDIKIACHYKKVALVLAEGEKILETLNVLYSENEKLSFLEEDTQDLSIQKVIAKTEGALEDILEESKLPPIVRVVDLIIYEGLRRWGSDIHIEPTDKDLSVRYRIDGVLHHGLSLPKKNQDAILARLKIMASLDITEFTVPQDGRFRIKFEGREIDFRVSSLPTNFGENIVLRILDKESLSLGLKKLGFSEVPLRLFEQALKAPFGVILVTGPTGSGKSTSLYSVITRLNTPEKNIITIEDPVEYQIEGITQIQAKPEIGLGFASALRSILRQSPDIIMVGEIRDAETVDIAIKASLTGEKMFSTLHTNNSVGAITRLIDMGVEPFLVAASLVATTAQRLVRKLCPKCKVKYEIEEDLLEKLGFAMSPIREFYKATGCDHCRHTGYRGRIALLEVLSLDDTIRKMIIKRSTEDEIIKYAEKNRDFKPLKQDGFNKCVEGITTLEEVLRVAG